MSVCNKNIANTRQLKQNYGVELAMTKVKSPTSFLVHVFLNSYDVIDNSNVGSFCYETSIFSFVWHETSCM